MIKIVYHSADFDGYCGGAIIYDFYREQEPELIPMNYSNDFPWDSISGEDRVFMTDFSLSMKDMELLQNTCKELVWLDHHKSAIENFHNYRQDDPSFNIPGERDRKFSGCELTWKYFFPQKEMPLFVWLLGRYDIWSHEESEDIEPFQFGMLLLKSEESRPDSPLWQRLFTFVKENDKDSIRRFVKEKTVEGKAVKKFCQNQDFLNSKSFAFEVEFEGKLFIAANVATMVTHAFNPERHYGQLLFTFRKKHWQISLRTSHEDADLSAIAKKYNGGGHPKAAGFYINKLPFELPERDCV